jgi:hypothetical protein
MSKSFLNFHTVKSLKGSTGFAVDSHRCALGGDEQCYDSGPVFFMLWHQVFCV